MFDKLIAGFHELLKETDSAKKLALRSVMLLLLSIIGGGIFTGSIIWANQKEVLTFLMSQQEAEFTDVILSNEAALKTFDGLVGARLLGVAEYLGGYSRIIWLSDRAYAKENFNVDVGSTLSISAELDAYNAHLRGKCYANTIATTSGKLAWRLTVPIYKDGNLRGYLGAILQDKVSEQVLKRELTIADIKEQYCSSLYVAASYLTQ
jgi:hypothetical protein